MTTSVLRTVVAGAMLLGLVASASGAILDATSFVAVRHLIPPPEDPLLAPNRDYQAGGISGAGDVFGMVNSVRGHQEFHDEYLEDPLVWKRSHHYEAKVALGGLPYFVPAWAFDLPPGARFHMYHLPTNGDVPRVIRQE